jgi:hypothetical protein
MLEQNKLQYSVDHCREVWPVRMVEVPCSLFIYFLFPTKYVLCVCVHLSVINPWLRLPYTR